MMREWKTYEEYVNFIKKLIVDNNWQVKIREKKKEHLIIEEGISDFIGWANKHNIFFKNQSVINLTELNLWNKNLTEIPSSIGNLKNLRYLNISCNYNLIKIPESIIKLQNLEQFIISRIIKQNNAELISKMASRNPKLKIIAD